MSIWHHCVKIRLTVWCTIDVMISFSCQALAKELVRSRCVVSLLYENKAQLNSVSMHLGEIVGMAIFEFFVGLGSDAVLESVLLISGRVILLVNCQKACPFTIFRISNAISIFNTTPN